MKRRPRRNAPPEPSAPPRRVSLKLTGIAQGGDAIAHLDDGRIVFVDGGLPGQEVEAELMQVRKRYARARVVDQPPLSPDACPHAPTCGGCRFQGASAAQAAAWKAEAAASAMQRLAGGVHWPTPDPMETGAVHRWRRRVRLLRDTDGQWGLRARGSHALVPLQTCGVLTSTLEEGRLALAASWASLELPLLEVHLDEDAVRGGLGVWVLPETRHGKWVTRVLREHLDAEPPPPLVTTVVVHSGDTQQVLWGAGTVAEEVVPGWTAELPVGAFRQAHGELNGRLQGLVEEAALEVGARSVVDLYAGCGNLSLRLALSGVSVTAVEGDGPATEAGRAWSSSPELEGRWTLLQADLEQALPDAVEAAAARAEVAIVDPPRRGVSPLLLDALASWPALTRVVMVSCDPATCARDVATLHAQGWRVTRWRFLDLFPWSAHLETFVVLDRVSTATR